MAGDARAAVEQLHRSLGEPCCDLFAHQAGRHRIPMSIQPAVVVETGAAAAPSGIDVGFRRQRQQSTTFRRLEQRAPTAAQIAHWTVVERLDAFADGGVQFGQGEESAMAQPASTQRCTTWTATSTLALSRGLRTRVDMIAVPSYPAVGGPRQPTWQGVWLSPVPHEPAAIRVPPPPKY